MTRLLWIPKSWKEFREHPETVYRTSNRLRAYNHHEILRDYPNVDSDVLGLTIGEAAFDKYDILVFQKHLIKTARIRKFRKKPGKLAVLDLCDPIGREEVSALNGNIDLVICSNHELEGYLRHNGLAIPTATVIDSHEADPSFIKRHTENQRPIITWYGVGANYFKFIKHLQPAFQSVSCDFRWVAEENPRWNDATGFQKGIRWQLSIKDAWNKPDSWQRFIQQSDIGIVPVFEAVKSPHKVLNYMAYGIPVICSPTDAHKRIVIHGETGFFATNSDEWANCINMLMDPTTRQRIGENARNTVLKRFSPEAVAQTYWEVLMSGRDKTGRPSRSRALLETIRQTFSRLNFAKSF